MAHISGSWALGRISDVTMLKMGGRRFIVTRNFMSQQEPTLSCDHSAEQLYNKQLPRRLLVSKAKVGRTGT